MSMNWRLASRLSVVTLAILVVLVVTLFQQRHTALPGTASGNSAVANTPSLQGTDLGNSPAPNFSLTDQFGKQISLAEFKGKPVVLTFLYTNCPDQCPLTAEKLHATLQELGNAAPNVGVLAVSTDPARDTTSAAMKFSQSHRMVDYWHYLVGPKSKLAPIWSAYSIYAQPQQQTVNHSLGLYVIDKQGHERVFLGNDFTPGQLAADLQVLLK
ncbi:MAG TPA: SCO family protein, partial [Ktedonobacteraceae bacterium]